MTLSDKVDSYLSGDKTHAVEVITRTQKATAYILDTINSTPGGWVVLKDGDNKTFNAACDLVKRVMGEVNFKNLIITTNILRVVYNG